MVDALRSGCLPRSIVDGDVDEAVLYMLPPPFLTILARYEATCVLLSQAYELIYDDEIWEQELQRRRYIEARLQRLQK